MSSPTTKGENCIYCTKVGTFPLLASRFEIDKFEFHRVRDNTNGPRQDLGQPNFNKLNSTTPSQPYGSR